MHRTKTEEKAIERITVQGFSLIEMAASDGRKHPEMRAAAMKRIEDQLRVLAEIGVKATDPPSAS